MISAFLDQFAIEPLAMKDFFLGFFMALALKRGRIKAILDGILPSTNE